MPPQVLPTSPQVRLFFYLVIFKQADTLSRKICTDNLNLHSQILRPYSIGTCTEELAVKQVPIADLDVRP